MNTFRTITGLLLLACVALALPIFDDPLLDSNEDSSSSSEENDWDLGIFRNIFGFFNFDNAQVINSTSQTKVVDGHMVTFNETIYKNDQNAIIKVDKYLIVPVDSSNSTEVGSISTSKLKDREEVTTEVANPTKKYENTNEIPKIASVDPNADQSAKKRVRRENVDYFSRRDPGWLTLLRKRYFPGLSFFSRNRRPDAIEPKQKEEVVDNKMTSVNELNSNSIEAIPESRESLEDIQEFKLPEHIESFENKDSSKWSFSEFENPVTEIPIDLSHDTRVNELMEAQPLRKPDPDVEIFSNSIVNVPYQPIRDVIPPNYTPIRYNYPRYDLRNPYEFNK